MKEKDLITAFSEITADESAKNEIGRKIFIKQKEKKSTFFKRPLIAVVAVACVFAMLKYLSENNLKPKYRTILAFPYSEEIGMGGTYVPPEVSEYQCGGNTENRQEHRLYQCPH